MSNKITKIIIVLLIVFAGLSFVAVKSISDENIHIYFLDVGQGDSVYVRYKNIDLLVDGGPDNSALYEIGNYRPFYDDKIEYVVLTHPHADHLVGLIDIIDRYNIGIIYMTDATEDTKAYKELLSIINTKKIPVKIVDKKFCQYLEQYYDLCFMYPTISYKDASIQNLNNTSIVNHITFGAIKIMLTGDIETGKQEIVAQENGLSLDSDIMKASHHGSSNGLNNNFIRLTSPELVIFSVGEDNKFGHPSQEYIDYLEKNNIKHYRTDQSGTVEIVSNGINFWTKYNN